MSILTSINPRGLVSNWWRVLLLALNSVDLLVVLILLREQIHSLLSSADLVSLQDIQALVLPPFERFSTVICISRWSFFLYPALTDPAGICKSTYLLLLLLQFLCMLFLDFRALESL